jgi:hypothetical protein
MVRGKKPLRSGVPVPKSVSSRVDCKCGTHLHLAVGHVVRAILHAAEDAVELRRQHMCICQIWVHGRRWLQIPWILRNCPTFSAAPRISVSLDTRRVEFASVIMHHERGRGIG